MINLPCSCYFERKEDFETKQDGLSKVGVIPGGSRPSCRILLRSASPSQEELKTKQMVGQLPADKDCNPLRYVLDMNMGQWCAKQRTCFVQNTQFNLARRSFRYTYSISSCVVLK